MCWVKTILVFFLQFALLQACPIGQAYSQPSNHQVYISLECRNKPLRAALDEIRMQSSSDIIYMDSLVDNIKISCSFTKIPIDEALKRILSGYDITYKKFENVTSSSYVLYKEKKISKKRYQALIVKQNTPGIDTSGFFIKPEMISKINLRYPEEAARRNIEGNVTIKFLVDDKGKVIKTKIDQSSGSSILDSATVYYASGLKFNPAQYKGKSRSIWMSMVFKYLISRE